MDAKNIVRVFSDCFEAPYRTRLIGGADEPLYKPAASDGDYHCIYFRSDYAASALHEVAHWCIAGAARRAQTDYGYWYEGERDHDTQRAFEQAETRPQGLEWLLSEAAGISFRVSCDNFDLTAMDLPRFRAAVRGAALAWIDRLPARAALFIDALSMETQNHRALQPSTYQELPK